MSNYINNLAIDELVSELNEYLNLGKLGIEKESLRVFSSEISKTNHPDILGSALCNQYITTDFSEAQLELITPAFLDKIGTLDFLDQIQHFTTKNIGDEILWPFSMPPIIKSQKDIRIADYGTSNLGRFKKIYRNGLAHRYGRKMQAISGVHINYSFTEKIWEAKILNHNNLESKDIRSSGYFRMLRNIFRMNWLILYLFGASPILTKDFTTEDGDNFKKLEDQIYYLPYATSLRMSNLGYQNSSRLNLSPSMNHLSEYIFDLKKATNTPHKDFRMINHQEDKSQKQLNDNILQIDDEYYAVARPKSNLLLKKRLINNLNKGGVNYIELRSIDLNPFNRVGIDRETLQFLEIFFIYSFLKASDPIDGDEQRNILNNDLSVAKHGRKPGLMLSRNGNAIELKDWANEILGEMLSITEMLDVSNQKEYSKIISLMESRVHDPSETLSGKLIEKILTNKTGFIDSGNSIGESYKQYYLNLDKSDNCNWDLFVNESIYSRKKQKELEGDSLSFENYKEEYFTEQ